MPQIFALQQRKLPAAVGIRIQQRQRPDGGACPTAAIPRAASRSAGLALGWYARHRWCTVRFMGRENGSWVVRPPRVPDVNFARDCVNQNLEKLLARVRALL